MNTRTAEEVARDVIGADALAGIGHQGDYKIAVKAITADRAERPSVTRADLVRIIRGLNAAPSTNPEYLRGQIELVMDVLGYECGEDEVLRASLMQEVGA